MESIETPFLSPSILSSDLADLTGALHLIEQGGGRAVHIDVMDGQFVPEITYGQVVVRSMRRRSALPFDVHLMTERPEAAADSFAEAGADWITFHTEATVHIDRLIHHIHGLGKKAGVAIVPSTPIAALEEILPIADIVLVMLVNPGFGGQSLIPSCLGKVARLAQIRKQKQLSFLISVDGGVNEKTIDSVVRAGADVIVSGSAFFNGRMKASMLRNCLINTQTSQSYSRDGGAEGSSGTACGGGNV